MTRFIKTAGCLLLCHLCVALLVGVSGLGCIPLGLTVADDFRQASLTYLVYAPLLTLFLFLLVRLFTIYNLGFWRLSNLAVLGLASGLLAVLVSVNAGTCPRSFAYYLISIPTLLCVPLVLYAIQLYLLGRPERAA